MDRTKNTSATPEDKVCKSWVGARFSLIDEGGVSKRRCKSLNCTKEYSRGTSHMILKRHWSKQHGDYYEEPARKQKNNLYNNASPKKNNHKSPKKRHPNAISTSLDSVVIRGNVGSQNSGSPNTNQKQSNNDKPQLDVKLVAKRLKEAVSIHLTFDIHNAKKGGKSYGIVTAHSVGDTPEIKSVLLEYKHLPYPDDSNSIFEFLRSCITRFNIREKIVSVTSGCSSSVTSAIQELDKRQKLSKNFNFSTIQVKCFPQFVHLNVMEVFRSQENLIDGVRKVVNFINSHNFTLRPLQQTDQNVPTGDLENSINSLGSSDTDIRSTGLKLPHDNRSSWNTTYKMIETFLEQRAFIEPTLHYFQSPQDLRASDIDWNRLFTLIQLLKPFYKLITYFATQNFTPISIVATCIPWLINHITNNSWNYDDLMMVAHSLKEQLESYQQQFHSDLTVVAGVLDPRIKDSFTAPESREGIISILRKRVDDSTNQIKEEFLLRMQEQQDEMLQHLFVPTNLDEVSGYLEMPRECELIDIFAYWEMKRKCYPCLYIMAKALLCVQATSVPCDRMFSAAENVEREKKLQLDNTNSKELMKSWAKYLEK